ncbi:uncharacterized protein KLTH0F14828g [Lachancea thermotolerans CBS 6340]|uniref:KLTH0F14828p n=1 Tax=Lachancea thermotolerans (strain ATCC 56472 / CBS 6340 / NRRL Y-8284) TaxID=559295 RepID=C5DJA4_LACTC|nr:KLTH0F14828p [Lachancea thermotolerans CBS 6340]CAR24393.1 KLTH0F14828p [Lachancea thermotolerans CBS 6340]
MFKKRQDPLEHLFQQSEPQTGDADKGFLHKVVSKEQEQSAYNSPFRTSQSLAAAQKRKMQKFPTVSASVSAHSSSDMGYKVIDAARRRAKDIAVPRYLQGNDERQRRRLDKLERKEDALKYKKDSQRIVDVRGGQDRAAGAAEDEGDVATDAEVEAAADAETEAEADAEAHTQTDAGADAGVAASTAESVAASTKDAEAVPATIDETPVSDTQDYVTPGAEAPDAESGIAEPETSAAIAESEVPAAIAVTETPVDGAAAEPEVPVAAAAESEVPAALPSSETAGAEPTETATVNSKEVAVGTAPDAASSVQKVPAGVDLVGEPAVAEAAGEQPATEGKINADGVPEKPKDIKETPRVPFATGIFALWTRSDKRGQPVASPNDPEFIVKFDKGYMSKALYDTLEYEEAIHKREMDDYTKEHDAKYEAKANEYEDRLTSLKSQIAELEATMETLQKDTTEKIEISEAKLSAQMIDLNAEHSSSKNVIFKETENMKAAKVEEKEGVEAKQEDVKTELEELEKLRAEIDAENREHQGRVDELTAELDAKLAAIQELNTQQAELQASIDDLQQQKDALISEANAADEQHGSNVAVLESIENKEYLPKLNAIDTKISELLTSLTVVKQETANHKTEFAAVSKRLEEEDEERKEKLRQEEENRKRLEAERLQKQREEHDQQILLLQQEHERQLAEASQKAAEHEQALLKEREQRELVERERVKLQGEKAIREQEEAKAADKALEEEIKQRNHSRALALDGAEAAVQKSQKEITEQKKTPLLPASEQKETPLLPAPVQKETPLLPAPESAQPKALTNDNSSLYEYFTEKEIRTVNSSTSAFTKA